MGKKTVIITGGSGGLGKAMATELAKENYNIIITGRNLDKLEIAKKEINEFSDNISIFQMDIRNIEDVDNLVNFAVNKYGSIDTLINNAAGNFITPSEDLSVNGWNAVVDIVLNGTWYCTQSVGKYWIKNDIQGNIINILATYAGKAGAFVVHSAAAKSGLLSITKTLALEWGTKYGIRVNAISPGPVLNTGGSEKLLSSDDDYKRAIDSIPLKRFVKPLEVANLASFLISDKATFINGECINIDGGMSLNTKRQFQELT